MPVQSAAMQWLALACSVGMLIYCSHRLAARFARDGFEHLFAALAFAVLQIGTLASALSFFNLLTPPAWLAAQAVVFLPLAMWLGRARKLGLRLRFESKLVFGLIAFMVLITLAKQVLLPVSHVDDRNYRASRAAYWLEHRNTFPWTTHNDRQIVFPLGGELTFFWPILFTRTEAPGLLAFWLAYPLAAAAAFAMIRELGQTARVAAIGALIFCCTPMVAMQTRGLSPEMWTTCFAAACGFWMLRAINQPATTRFVFAGIFAGLAFNTRATALPLLIVLPVMPWIISTIREKLRASAAILAGIAVAILLGGSMVVFANNLARFHHPLGSAAFRHVHSADLSFQQFRTHAARMLITLIEPPIAPGERTRDAVETSYAELIARLGADKPLPMEGVDWLGTYRPNIGRFGENYSLPGLIWLPALLAGLVIGAKRDKRLLALSLLATVFLLAVVFRVRWMATMGRFWIAPYTLSLPIIVALIAPYATRKLWLRVVVLLAIGVTVSLTIIARATDAYAAFKTPMSSVELDEPFAEPLARIPRGATILLVGDQGTRDYPLFLPREGFANRVISWGKSPFDPQRMQDLLAREKIDHITIQNDRRLDLHWDPPIDTTPMARWLDGNPQWQRVPLEFSPGMRLYARKTP